MCAIKNVKDAFVTQHSIYFYLLFCGRAGAAGYI
jgi:hypothetical protein